MLSFYFELLMRLRYTSFFPKNINCFVREREKEQKKYNRFWKASVVDSRPEFISLGLIKRRIIILFFCLKIYDTKFRWPHSCIEHFFDHSSFFFHHFFFIIFYFFISLFYIFCCHTQITLRPCAQKMWKAFC